MDMVDGDWLLATLYSGSNGLLIGILLGDGSLHGQERVGHVIGAMMQLLATLTQQVGAMCYGA